MLFFGLTFAFAVPFWLLASVARDADGPFGLPLSALQFVAPFIAAVVVTFRRAGTAETLRFLGRAIDPSRARPFHWLLPALFIIPAVYAGSWLLMAALRRPLPEFDLAWGSLLPLLAVFLVTGWFEEVGWTGSALGPAQRRWGNALRAALVIGVVWAAIHIVPDLQAGHDVAWIAWHRLSSLAQRVLIVWVALHTGGSVVAAAAMHAMDNVSWQLLPRHGSAYEPAFVAPLMVLVAALVVVTHGRHLVRRAAVPAQRLGQRREPEG